MPENQNPIREQIALPPAVAPVHSPPTVLGEDVVAEHDEILAKQFEIDKLQSHYDRAKHLETKKTPEDGFMDYQLGRLAGKSLTHREARWLDRNIPSDLELRMNQRQRLTALHEAEKSENLLMVRERLSGLSGSEKKLMDRYLGMMASPFLETLHDDFQDKRYAEAEQQDPNGPLPDLSWAAWLQTKATDEQLTNFLQWHVHTLAEQSRSKEVAAAIEEEGAAYKIALRKGIDAGWLSSDAEGANKRR